MLSCLKPLWQCLTLSLPAGVRMGSLGLFLQCVTSIFFSTIMDRMVKQFGTRAVYLASVVFFPAAAFVMCLSHSVIVVTISAALTGFTFSALQILPYTLASLYHHEKQVGICSGAARMVWVCSGSAQRSSSFTSYPQAVSSLQIPMTLRKELSISCPKRPLLTIKH